MKRLLVFALLLLNFSILAQENTVRGVTVGENKIQESRQTWAIIVGISNYLEVKDLQFADQDATLFAQYLEKDLNIPKNNIKLFINEEATRFNIVDELYHLNELVKPNDLVYFYFAGHGDLEAKIAKENALLLLYKSLNISYLKGTDYISVMELRQWLDNLTEKKAQVIFISDACHAGGLIGGAEGQEKTTSALNAEWKNQTKLLSCQANELSLESKEWGGGRGLFSYHLIEGLQGLADIDEDKGISLFELQVYLQTQVRKQALPNHQTPVAIGNLDQILGKINPQTLLSLRERKAKSYPILASVNAKGIEDKLLTNADSLTRYYYAQYKKNLELKNFTHPENNCALYFFKKIKVTLENEDAVRIMRRNLAAALQDKAMKIIKPTLEGRYAFQSLEECRVASKELRIAKDILGEGHYLSNNLEARALYLDQIIIELNDKYRYYRNYGENPKSDSLRKKLLYKSISLEPNTPYAILELAHLSKKESAITLFSQYLNVLPNNEYAHRSLGFAYFKNNKLEKAIYHLKRAIDLNSQDYYFYLLLADIYVANNQIQQAKESYIKSVLIMEKVKYGDEDELLASFANVLHQMSYFKEASIYYQKAIKINPENIRTLNNMAYNYICKNDYDSASRYLEKLIFLDKNHALSYANLGVCYYAQKNFKKASLNFSKSIELNPNGLDFLAKGYHSLKNFDFYPDIVKKYQIGSISFFDCLIAYEGLGYSLINQKEFYQAENVFKKAVNLDSKNPRNYYNLACLYSLQNKIKDSVNWFEQAIQKGFNDFEQIQTDPDLDHIRQTYEFKALIQKYFPNKK